MKRNENIHYDNASQRLKASSHIFNVGSKEVKRRTLERLKPIFSSLHNDGKIHIHDLDTYSYTYNCLQMDVLQSFPYDRFNQFSDFRKISGIFDHYRNLILKLGHEQSGGIGFPNFDKEITVIFNRLNMEDNPTNRQVLRDSIESFIDWINETHERNCQYTFYVTLNLGLCTQEIGRFATRAAIEYFMNSSSDIIKPNIIFKVKKGVNYLPMDPNYDLFELAVKSTCKKMIPTYILFDSKSNEMWDPEKVAIMGCRTKVVANLFGEPRSIGRANIAYVTINLPRIALEIDRDFPDLSIDDKFKIFKQKWTETAVIVKDILLDRYNGLLKLKPEDFPCNYRFNLWIRDFKTADSLEEIFKTGTLSIGFIGLSEAVEVLSGEKYYSSHENYLRAIDFVKYMRNIIDGFRDKYNLNFTLLASSGEFISGRFPAIDRNYFNHSVIEKGFYTNSFHVDVDSGLHPLKKIMLEGPFHLLCNGGCISYVEFSSAPLNNTEAVKEIIEAAINNGVNYLGINFPLDHCRNCGYSGTFDSCPRCGGVDIHRIRRVSGYLEDLDFFTVGKKAEVAHRTPNLCINHKGRR